MAKATILIVDDEKEIRNLIEIYLKTEGYTTLKASNGLEALEALKNNVVHLIILDIMMPKMDGIQACMKIKEERNTPIIMLSAKGQDADMILGLGTGADDYVTKPFNEQSRLYDIKIMITDVTGKILAKSQNVQEIQVDIFTVIKNVADEKEDTLNVEEAGEFLSFHPVSFKDNKVYLIVAGMPKGITVYRGPNNVLIAYLIGISAFITLFFILTRKKMKYIEELAGGLLEISRGNLEFRVPLKSRDELGSLASNINYMAKEFQNTIEKEREIERAKNELITNVSHNLRTPLTSIMGCLRLIKDKKYDEEELAYYIDIACGKSEKLKVLIDDLFEYTKLTDRAIKLNLEKINLNGLLEQLIEEFTPVCEENGLVISK